MAAPFAAGWLAAAVLAGAPSAPDAGTQKPDPAVARGAELYQTYTCSACHSLDGSTRAAPSFEGLFGKTEKLNTGKTVVVDEAYIRESIQNPGAKVVHGFFPTMPPFKGRLSDEEIDALIAFIKILR